MYVGDFFVDVTVRGAKKRQYSLKDFVPYLNAADYSVIARRLEPLVVREIRRFGN